MGSSPIYRGVVTRDERKYSAPRFSMKSQPKIDVDDFCEDIMLDENINPNESTLYSKLQGKDDTDLVVFITISSDIC
jgi:hypothetical protein